MRRDELIANIQNMSIHEQDYLTLKNLVDNADDGFFVKIMESLFNDELFIQDFERSFNNGVYENTLLSTLESQEKLRVEMERIAKFRINVLGEDGYSVDAASSKLGIAQPVPGGPYETLYDTMGNEIQEDLFYQMLATMPGDNDAIRATKLAIFNAYQSGTISKDDLLFFAYSYIVPISFEHQMLTDMDRTFMLENNLSKDEIKKMKSLATFIRRKGSV